jgi:hypothetical protein
MTGSPPCHVIRLIEISPLNPGTDLQDLRMLLGELQHPRIRLVPAAHGIPWVLVHTQDLAAETLLEMIPLARGIAATELRSRLELTAPTGSSLCALIEDAQQQGTLVIGRAAVERAAQRRRLDIVILADGIDPEYADSLQKIILGTAPGLQVVTANLTTTELGTLTRRKRAGVLGLARGYTALRLPGQTRQSRGRIVSSVPGSSSSAPARLNGHRQP